MDTAADAAATTSNDPGNQGAMRRSSVMPAIENKPTANDAGLIASRADHSAGRASIKSAEIMRDACQADVPATIVGRTEAMEKRMETTLQALRAVRPALEAFYATLSDGQKARLDSNVGRGRPWRWHDRW